MIKLVILCVFSFVTYLSLLSVDQLSTHVLISFLDYTIEVSLLFAILTFILSIIIVVVAINISTLIFDLPGIIKNKIETKKSQKTNSLLIQSAIHLLIDNKNKAKHLSAKINSNVEEYIKLKNLILAESEEDTDKKLDYYQKIASLEDCQAFANRKLAQIYFDRGSFLQAESYADKVLSLFEKDIIATEILVNCCAQQKVWKKYDDNINKLKKLDIQTIDRISKQLSTYYIQASKEMLETGEDHQAIHYVESALELNPTNTEALDLYTSINLSLNNGQNNLEILSNAFAFKPSFEIAVMYINTTTQSPQQIYKDLSALVDFTDPSYKSLFLSIKAYLNLSDYDNQVLSDTSLTTN